MTKKKFTWSYSSLTAFETCAFRWWKTKWTKEVVEPQTEATLWGNRVHKAMEERLRDGKPLPEGMTQFEPIAKTILRQAEGAEIEVEQKLAINAQFQKTGYFDKDVWLRCIADVIVTKGDKCFIGDHKTGKMSNAPDSDQLALTSAVVFAHKPWVKSVLNSFIWLREGKTTSETFSREDVPRIWQKFLPRVARMEEAIKQNKFPPRPSGLCREWCPVHSCVHNGKYKGPVRSGE